MLTIDPALGAALRNGGKDLRILLIRLGAMGDILRAVPSLQALRRGLPDARLIWVLDEHWRLLLEGHPSVDEVIGVPRKEMDRLRRSPSRWLELWRLTRRLRTETRSVDADLAIDFHGNLRSGLVSFGSHATHRLGYDGHQQKESNRWFMNLHLPSGTRRTSRIDRNLALVASLGIPTSPFPSCDLPLPDRGRDAADAIRGELGGGRYAIISPGASPSQAYKRPPAEILIESCHQLHARGVSPWVQFGPGEEEDARVVVEGAGQHARLCPPTKIPVLADLIRGATMFVGGDSGPLHLACAVGCPVVGLYGPTDPVVNAPWGSAHRVVFPADREYTGIKRQDRVAGFEGLSVASVVAAIESLLIEVGDGPV
ncbi:MAG: glycosyltransferase family 9 protein [Acidobacteriota bacterium]|nr:glycosyltransferase family 9 protein [Acidobacteriota bacterium]